MKIVEIFKAYCEYHKIPTYKKRIQVLNYLASSEQSTDAESIWMKFRFDGHSTSRTSVYLALHWLAERGFVTCDPNHRKALYTLQAMQSIQELIPQKV